MVLRWFRQMMELGPLYRHRTVIVAAIAALLGAAANYIAFLLRFDGDIPANVLSICLRTMPWMLVINGTVFAAFGVYRSSWRFTGVWDLRDLVGAVGVSSLAFYVLVHEAFRHTAYPRTVFIITAFLSIGLIGGARLARRLAFEARSRPGAKRVLIYGAGHAGEMIVRDLKRSGYQPVGFVDDDLSKIGQRIHRVRVLGTRDDLPRIIARHDPDEVLVAMPSVEPAAIRRIVSALEPFKVGITTLPPVRETLDGKVTVKQMRKLAVEDLLPRSPVQLDNARARALIEGRRILVTGAGGSIGSELCRQILALHPERLILYERYENNLYTVLKSLSENVRAHAVLGDVTDARRLNSVLSEHRPHVVFHAAAHKHVPLMELNPCEAVKNNVIGTRMVAEASRRHGVERFILISTDKAVNPSSFMGATKRIAELMVQSIGADDGLRCATVRFGNVLGSNGSVIPHWLDQIALGGPVTVTDPEIRRFFMLIPEAVQLILQAASVTRGGEIFVLDMGEQIKLLDMARNLIRLSGFVPDEEIAIKIVGLRPGEKLYEELVGPEELLESSPADKVLQLRTPPFDPALLFSRVTELGRHAAHGDTGSVLDLIRRIVPTFRPSPEFYAATPDPVGAAVQISSRRGRPDFDLEMT